MAYRVLDQYLLRTTTETEKTPRIAFPDYQVRRASDDQLISLISLTFASEWTDVYGLPQFIKSCFKCFCDCVLTPADVTCSQQDQLLDCNSLSCLLDVNLNRNQLTNSYTWEPDFFSLIDRFWEKFGWFQFDLFLNKSNGWFSSHNKWLGLV